MSHNDATLSQAHVNTRHALTIVGALCRAGVRDVVVSPGSRNTPLVFAFDAFERKGLLRIHVALDERVAAFIALGIGRATRAPVAMTCTSGSAGAHYLPALAEARRSAIPLIAVTADRPEELQDIGAPQTMDQTRLFDGHIGQRVLLAAPSPSAAFYDDTWQRVLRAATQANELRHPLHLNVPLREPLWDPSCDALLADPLASCPQLAHGFRLLSSAHSNSCTASQSALQELRPLLQMRGAIVVGPIDAGQLSDEECIGFRRDLDTLSAALNWPLFGDAVSPLRVANAQEYAYADLLFRDDALLNGDTIQTLLVVGPWPTSKPLGLWLQRHPGVRVISMPGVIGAIDPWHRVYASISGPIAQAIRALSPVVKDAIRHANRSPNLESELQEALSLCKRIGSYTKAIDETIADFCAQHPHFEGAIARAVVNAVSGVGLKTSVEISLGETHSLEDGPTLHIASSMPIRDVDAYSVGPKLGVRICASRGVNGIDGNIATAFGAAVGRQKPAVLLIGDLAFRHDVGALAHAAGHDEALTIVVVDNNGGGIFRHLAVSEAESRFERYFLTPQASSIEALALGCGARVHRAAGANDAARLVRKCQDRAGTDVILIEVDGTRQVAYRKEAVARALAAARALLPS